MIKIANKNQSTLFEMPVVIPAGKINEGTGRELRDIGIQKAVDHANEVEPKWSDQAYAFLVQFLRIHEGEFMTEMVRGYATANGLSVPPSKRAWGAIVVKAAKNNLIVKKGYNQVTNPEAHMANAYIWVKK